MQDLETSFLRFNHIYDNIIILRDFNFDSNCHDYVSICIKYLFYSMGEPAPLRFSVAGRRIFPRTTDDIKILVKDRDREYKVWTRLEDPSIYDSYRALRIAFTRLLGEARKVYNTTRSMGVVESNDLWREFRSLDLVRHRCEELTLVCTVHEINAYFLSMW